MPPLPTPSTTSQNSSSSSTQKPPPSLSDRLTSFHSLLSKPPPPQTYHKFLGNEYPPLPKDVRYTYVTPDVHQMMSERDHILKGRLVTMKDLDKYDLTMGTWERMNDDTLGSEVPGLHIRERRKDDFLSLPPSKLHGVDFNANNGGKNVRFSNEETNGVVTEKQRYDDYLDRVSAGLQRRLTPRDKRMLQERSEEIARVKRTKELVLQEKLEAAVAAAEKAAAEDAAEAALKAGPSSSSSTGAVPIPSAQATMATNAAKKEFAALTLRQTKEADRQQRKRDLLYQTQLEVMDNENALKRQKQKIEQSCMDEASKNECYGFCKGISDFLWDLEFTISGIKMNPFRAVIDTKTAAELAPGYFNVVKRAMNLEYIKRNVAERRYTKVQGLMDDVTLMIANCKTYSPQVDNEYHMAAVEMQGLLKKNIQKIKMEYESGGSSSGAAGSEE